MYLMKSIYDLTKFYFALRQVANLHSVCTKPNGPSTIEHYKYQYTIKTYTLSVPNLMDHQLLNIISTSTPLMVYWYL
jgi:hypothetical protein